MKKRILSILLLCCMVLTLLPTAAFAAGKIRVGTEEELLAALADNTIDKITLTADITVSQTLVIDRQVVLVLDHRLKMNTPPAQVQSPVGVSPLTQYHAPR